MWRRPPPANASCAVHHITTIHTSDDATNFLSDTPAVSHAPGRAVGTPWRWKDHPRTLAVPTRKQQPRCVSVWFLQHTACVNESNASAVAGVLLTARPPAPFAPCHFVSSVCAVGAHHVCLDDLLQLAQLQPHPNTTGVVLYACLCCSAARQHSNCSTPKC